MSDGVKAYMESIGLKEGIFEKDSWFPDLDKLVDFCVSKEAAEFFYNAQKEAVRKVLERAKSKSVVIRTSYLPPIPGEMVTGAYHGRAVVPVSELDSIIKELEG